MPFRRTMRAEGRPSLAAVARTAALGSWIFAASASWNHFSNWRNGSRATSFSDSPAREYSVLRSARVILGHPVPEGFPCQKHLPRRRGGSARQRAHKRGVSRELANERDPFAELKFPLVPRRRNRASEEGPSADAGGWGRTKPRALPGARGDDRLRGMGAPHVAPQDDRPAGAGDRVEQGQLRGIPGVEMPDLIHAEPVKRRKIVF